MPSWLRTVRCWSLTWLTPLTAAMILATITNLSIPYDIYFWLRSIGAVVIFVMGIATTVITFKRAMGQWREEWELDGRIISLVVFWALFPPMWFFTEYYCFDTGLVGLPEGATKDTFLAQSRHYAGFAANIWAAFGALLAFVITQAKRNAPNIHQSGADVRKRDNDGGSTESLEHA